jgi:protocatechuate 3,4-dioxygenase beta subunit
MNKPGYLNRQRIALLALFVLGVFGAFFFQNSDQNVDVASLSSKLSATMQKNRSLQAREGLGISGSGSGLDASTDTLSPIVQGVVLSPTGKPVIDAVVLALPINKIDGEPSQTTTKDAGVFSFTTLTPGTYKFSASAPIYTAVSSRDITLLAGQQRHDLTLRLLAEGFTLSGTVDDTGGGSISGAAIYAKLGWNNTTFQTQSNVDGHYRFKLPPGSYKFTANANMYASQSQRLQLSADRRLDFKLTPAATVHGRVLVRDLREGVPDARVRLHDTKGWQWEQRTLIADAEGFFEFENVDPGNYELSAHKGNLYGTHPKTLAVTVASATANIEIEMDTGFTISGQIKDMGGVGIAQASVMVHNRSGRSRRIEVATDAQGEYLVPGLPQGRYSLRAKAQGFSNERLNEVSVIDQDLHKVDLTLKDGVQISGRFETQSGEPIMNAVIRGSAKGGFWFFGGYDEDQSLHDGTFHLENLPSGDIQIQATHLLIGATAQVVSALQPGEHRTDVVLISAPGTKVEGVVTWDDGSPADGVHVYARALERSRGKRAPETIADQDGAFTLSPLWEGQFQIWATTRLSTGWRPHPGSMGSAPVSVSLDAKKPTATASLTIEKPNQMIQGRVLDPDGKPLSDCQVGATRELNGTAQPRRWQPSLGEEITQSAIDGTFTLSNLPSGTYILKAMHPLYPKAKSDPVVAGTRDFVFHLQKGASLAGVVKRGGKPVSSYDIAASLPNQVVGHHMQLPGAKVSDPNGSFLIQGLPAGLYTLTVETSDKTAGRLDGIDLAIGETKTGLSVDLEEGVQLTGKIVDDTTGANLGGVHIFASSAGGRYSTQSDEQGDFSLSGIAKGSTVRLYVAADTTTHIPDIFNMTASQMKTDLGTLRIVPLHKGDEQRFPLPLSFKNQDLLSIAEKDHEPSGIHSGDILLAINTKPIKGLGKHGLEKYLTAPEQHQTTLSLTRNGQAEAYDVTLTHMAPANDDTETD